MEIREMSNAECLLALANAKVARLACARENQPYVLPVYLTYHQAARGEPCLYGFATHGQKVEWMRLNPSVCVEVDEIKGFDQWMSVIAVGRYEELPKSQEHAVRAPGIQASRLHNESVADSAAKSESLLAYELLQARAMWWDPATSARVIDGVAEPVEPIFFKIHIDQVSGHAAAPKT